MERGISFFGYFKPCENAPAQFNINAKDDFINISKAYFVTFVGDSYIFLIFSS